MAHFPSPRTPGVTRFSPLPFREPEKALRTRWEPAPPFKSQAYFLSRFAPPLPCFLALFPDSFHFLNKQLLRSSLHVHLCCFFQGHVSTSFPHVKQTAFLLLSLVSRGCLKQRGGWGPPLQGWVRVDAETHICRLVCLCVQGYMSVYLGTHMYICACVDIHTCVCVSTCGHYVHVCV